MLTCHDSETAERARRLRSHGLTTSAFDRARGKALYEVMEPGFNFRMDDIHAALGRVQLGKYQGDRRARQQVYLQYVEELSDVSGVTIPFRDYSGESGYHIFPLYVGEGNRAGLAEFLKERRIQSSYHYAPIHEMEHYRKAWNQGLPLTERLRDSTITLPFHAGLDSMLVKRVTDSIREYFSRLG